MMQDFVNEAEQSFRALGTTVPAGIPSSDHYDAGLITWHVLYWTGKKPEHLARSRGHSYKFGLFGAAYVVRVTDYNDHREGVSGFPHGSAAYVFAVR